MKTQIKFTILIACIFYVVGSGICASFNIAHWPLELRERIGGVLIGVIICGWGLIAQEKS